LSEERCRNGIKIRERVIYDWEIILDTSFSETKVKDLSMVGLFSDETRDDETVVEQDYIRFLGLYGIRIPSFWFVITKASNF